MKRSMEASVSPFQTQPEVCYGTKHFQVRIWTFLAHQRFLLPTLPGQSRSHTFLIEGLMDAVSQTPSEKSSVKLSIGQHFVWDAGQVILENLSNASASLLEILEADMSTEQTFEPVQTEAIPDQRPWGSFTVLKDENHYKLKQLWVKPNNRLSLQRHQHREEHWLVIQGRPQVIAGDASYQLQAGDFIQIPKHAWHRLSNMPSNQTEELSKNTPSETSALPPEPVEVIELQLGDYFGEDDIERASDDYGRLST